MVPVLALTLGSLVVLPSMVEQNLGATPPLALWIPAGTRFDWPVPPSAAKMTYSMWKATDTMINLLADPVPAPIPALPDEGSAMAGADYAPVTLTDGTTVESTIAYLVRALPSDGSRPMPSRIATAKSGWRMEIRLLMDPTYFDLGSDIAVKTYNDGAGVKVPIVVTDPSGLLHMAKQVGSVAYLHLDQPGIWTLRAQYQVRAGKKPLVRTSTLYFENKKWN